MATYYYDANTRQKLADDVINKKYGAEIDAFNKAKGSWQSAAGQAIHNKVQAERAKYNYDGGVDGTQNKQIGNGTVQVGGGTGSMAGYDAYMGDVTKGLDREGFVNNFVNSAKGGAELQFGNSINDLKNKLARNIAGYQNRLGQVDASYLPLQQNNDQQAYGTSEDIKRILAKRGLLGSGVEVGNVASNGATYNRNKQDIELQKMNEKTTLQNMIDTTNETGANDLATLEQQKNAYISKAMSDSNMAWEDKVDKVKAMASDSYWKGAAIDSDVQKFNAMSINDITKFNETMRADAEKFATDMGFKYDEAVRMGDEFDAKLKFDKEALKKNTALGYAQLKNAMDIANMNHEDFVKKYDEEKRQFDEEFKLQTKDSDMKQQQMYAGENERLDAEIMKFADYAQNAPEGDKQKWLNSIPSLIMNSILPTSMKYQKIREIGEAWGIDTSKWVRYDSSTAPY